MKEIVHDVVDLCQINAIDIISLGSFSQEATYYLDDVSVTTSSAGGSSSSIFVCWNNNNI